MKHNYLVILLSTLCFCSFSLLSSAQEIGFEEDFQFAGEADGQLEIALEVAEGCDCELEVLVSTITDFGQAQQGADYLLNESYFIYVGLEDEMVSFTIDILDNAAAEADKFFVLTLPDNENYSVDKNELVVFITDNDTQAPVGTEALDLQFAASYLVDADGSAEIVAHDPVSQRLFVMNSTSTKLEILDFSDPLNMTNLFSVDLSQFGIGGTGVAFQNGIVAVTIEGADFQNGEVVFLDIDGNIISDVLVGVLPDMVVFTPDGLGVLTANEGQPADEYELDPEGTISYIDISGGVSTLTQDQVTTMNFNAFDDQIEELRAAGVRIFGLNASVSRDMEPEFITVSADSQTAWVSCQENNALAVVDIATLTITDIIPLGTKDHSITGNSVDFSDRNDEIFMGTWEVKGMYMPDAIASYSVGNDTYIITANEGDQREYGVINEDVSVKDDDVYFLDEATFPNADLLREDYLLGRLAVSPYSGDTDGDGDIDEIHCFGSRSFSIWNSATGERVYDSGDDFERITAADPVYGELFNASNSNDNFKNRSDNKGPEPEGVTVAEINGVPYAFITLERIGGIMTYDISDPAAPVFVSYKNSRTVGGEDEGGDLGPEGIIYISAQNSPTGVGMVIMANEVSATLSIYNVTNDTFLLGCTDAEASNYNELATDDDGSCLFCSEGETCEAFEAGFGSWSNSSEDDFNWTSQSGATPSSGTGPSASFDGDNYVFIEASFPNYPNKSAALTSSCYEVPENGFVEFAYQMLGVEGTVGALQLAVSTDQGTTYTTIWTAEGNQGSDWLIATVDISELAGELVQFQLEGTTASSWRGDMAVDAFCVKSAVLGCTNPLALNYDEAANIDDDSCDFLVCDDAQALPYCTDFEVSSGLNGWTFGEDSDFNWALNSGGTPSFGTGPLAAFEGSSYAYMEASHPNYPNKQAIIESPCLDLTEEVNPFMLFNYHMNGDFVGFLSLQASSNGDEWVELWALNGDQGADWTEASVDLAVFSGQTISVRFVGETINGWRGDIALDNVCVLSNGEVQTLAQSSSNMSQFKSTKQAAISTNKNYVEGADEFQEPEFGIDMMSLEVFPNPVQIGQPLTLNIQSVNNEELVTVRVLNMLGAEVYSEVVKAQSNIELNLPANLSSGTYLVSVTSLGAVTTERIVVGK